MRILGVFYLLLGLVFFFFHNELFYLINVGPKILKITEAIPEPVEDLFWLVQAVSLMILLSAICFLAAESPGKRGYTVLHLLAKSVSITGFIYVFVHHHPYFAYATGAAMEILITIFVLWNMIRLGRK